MDKLKIDKLHPTIDGEYEFSLSGLLSIGGPDSLTNRELHVIKTLSGVRLFDLDEAILHGDNDVLVAITKIVLARHGRQVLDDVLWDAPLGRIEMDLEEAEDDAGPPPMPTSEPESHASNGFSSIDSASDSMTLLESPANDQAPTGNRDSERSAISGQETLPS